MRVSDEALAMALPAATEPVSDTMATSGWATRATPAVSPCPQTTFRTPGGRTSAASSASRSAVYGVSSEGFSTTVLPTVSAGATFQVAMLSG